MKLTFFLLFALVAIVCATFNTTVITNGVNYVVFGIPDSDIKCSKSKWRWSAYHIEHTKFSFP